MPAQPLHPNLARLAAAYDNVIERYSRREINPNQARSDILALVARDDNGVQWSIDPDSGDWCYRNLRGQLVVGDPPSYGLATPTAHDLSRNPDAFNPDTKIQFQEVDETLLHPPGSLIGSTRRIESDKSGSFKEFIESTRGKVLSLLAVIAVVSLVVFNINSGDETVPVPVPPPAIEEAPAAPPVAPVG